MVRAPCCEKMGLMKGPWTPEEDHILVSHIHNYGHGNWRALPKQAGLLRCGKSCRLRWINYLRPDIKRGNFTREEEDTIIGLHEKLGNRWSAIAAQLPGRTDNEIKNVWHTHIKKRLDNTKLKHTTSSDQSSSSTNCAVETIVKCENLEYYSEPENCRLMPELYEEDGLTLQDRFPVNSFSCAVEEKQPNQMVGDDDALDFWYKMLVDVGGTVQEFL